ncbi:hypothetical protein ABPG73_022996 [Tetrahymena malaccensis]
MCKDKNADPQQKCLICKKQYFFNSLTHNCQLCDAQCVACSGQSNNCTECLYINQITPNCDCIQFKQTQQNTCQCNNNCLSCSGIDSNFCFTCTSDKREPPACKCSPNYKEIQNECVEIKITCDPQCTQCSKASNYCTSCSQNRVNPPICQCQEGYEGIQDGSCQPCQLGTYYDFEIRSCRPCGYEQQFNKSQYNQQDCLKDLNVIKFSSFQQNQQYFLMFTFDKNLKNFNVTQFQLFKIVQFYIPEVSNNTYSIINPLYNGNTFQVQLKVKNNFRADYIFAIIINNTYFLSQDTQYILGQKYLNTQMKAKIGPFIFLEDILDNQKLDSVSNYLGEFKSSNQNIFSIINQLQFLFYVLNTLQPVSVFLLLDLIYPPQLYKFYQIIGIFVFPSVPDYLNEIPKRKFYLFNYELEGIDAEQPHFGKLKNLGFNLSIIVNIPILLIKQFSILFFIFSTIIIQKLYTKRSSVFQKIKTFLIQTLNSDQETTLAIIFICIFIQFIEINQESYIYRTGFYISIILITIQIIVFKLNLMSLNSKDDQLKEYSKLYIERISENKSWLSIYHFQIQTIKKYIYLAVICFLFNYPYIICSFCGVIFLLSAIQTVWAQAYKSKISRVIKFVGEIIFSAVWFIHIQIYNLEQKFQQEKIIDSQLLNQYILIGNLALWLLVTYNCLFLIQFLLDIIKMVSNLRKKNNSSNQNQNKTPIKLDIHLNLKNSKYVLTKI